MKSILVAVAAFALLLGWPARALAAPVTSVSQYGITWTFSEPREAGQYASGDWWVVGPVSVTEVSPAPTPSRNGSCVNPKGGRQGYDSRGGEFATTDRVTFPYTLTVDQSLVSSVSQAEGIEVRNVGALRSQAVLTAVAAPPPKTALRPAYAGTRKRSFDTSRIDFTRLPKLPAPSSLPDGKDLLRMADRPRIDHISSWTIQDTCAQDNWYNGEGQHACYGREYATFISDAALYIMLDTPERVELTTSLVQLGIDNYGVLEAGGNWAANGGHHNARKFPILLAARLLDDCDMLKFNAQFGPGSFGEDDQTYAGKSGKALFGWDCGGGQGSYFENGCSGSGAKDCRDPAGAADGCEDYRDCCTSGYWVGEMLATLMLRSKAVWAHDPFFDYVDRWMAGDVTSGAGASSPFVKEMWTKYRGQLPEGAEATTTCGPTPPPVAGPDGGALPPGSPGSSGLPDASAPGNGPNGATPGATPASEADDGCGCRFTPVRISPAIWLGGLALVGLAMRRRANRRRR